MGMFDDIKCEYPLQLPEVQGELAGLNWRQEGFQTKDLDCLMDAYCIREDGTLWQQTYVWETTRKGRPYRRPAGWRAMTTYTGMVRFYHSILRNKADYWVEWIAVLVAGKVTEIKLQHWEENDNRERLPRKPNGSRRRKSANAFSRRGLGEAFIRAMRGSCMAASGCQRFAVGSGSAVNVNGSVSGWTAWVTRLRLMATQSVPNSADARWPTGSMTTKTTARTRDCGRNAE